MKIIHRDCPIAVISTNTHSSAAIGIIRFSGFKNISEFSSALTVNNWVPRHAHFLKVLDEQGLVMDEGIGLFFEGPNSFTGENLLELHLHGNPVNLKRILNSFITRFNLQDALPGEFSYRAFKNEKMNLSQVEGLDLLLNANTGFGLSAATEMLNNELYKSYLELRSDYLELRSTVELSIDFSEDVGEEEIAKKVAVLSKSLQERIEGLFRRCSGRLSDLLTPSIGLFGKTNAGKSTLFNKLIGNDRAIVSSIHGTTRDYVSEYWQVEETPFRLLDTAGIRESADAIESEGISRSLALVGECFFKILVINPFENQEDYPQDILSQFNAIIFSHLDLRHNFSDLPQELLGLEIPKFSLSGPIGPEFRLGPIGPVFKSSGPMGAVDSDGPIGPGCSLEELISTKYQSLMSKNPIPIQRHRDLIAGIYQRFQSLMPILATENDIAIISSEINALGVLLDELLGIVNSQEVLDHIFANFCIGK